MNKALLLLLIGGCSLMSCSKKLTGLNWNFLDRNKLEVREVEFDYLNARGKMSIQGNDSDVSAKTVVRIRKDSLIWLSFSSAGIQGARAIVNKDSIVVVNHLRKEYYVYEFDSLAKKFNLPIHFDLVQAIALGNLIKPREEDDEVLRKDDHFLLRQKVDFLTLENRINSKYMKLEGVLLKDPETGNELRIRYADFQLVEDKAFPYSIIISLLYHGPEGPIRTDIEIEYNKAEMADKELRFPFNIPKKYDRR
jgi:hypothetical protein